MRRRQLEGLEPAGRLPGSSPTQRLAKMVAEVGPSKTNTEAGCIRPTLGEGLCKEFFRGWVKEASEILARDSGSL